MGKLNKKASHLFELMSQFDCINKTASEEVKTKDLEAAQPTIGDEMQKETESGTQGNYASAGNDASIEGAIPEVDKVEGSDEKPAAAVLSETGSKVDNITPCETSTGTPAQVAKSASLKLMMQAAVEAEIRKEAALKAAEEAAAKEAEMEKQASAQEEEIVTATSVMNKIAAFAETKTAEQVEALTADVEVSFNKLAASNPLFNVAREHVLLRKMAAEVEALAAAEGIYPEEAAAALDASIENDPEAQAEMMSEVDGEALSDLAAAEQEQAAIMDGLESTAAQVSEALGTTVTSDDLMAAVEQVCAQAEELGVEPEVLIQAAAEEMMGGEEVTPEDEALAEELIQAAAAEGISPEELIAGLSQELEGGEEAAPAEAPAEEAAAEAAPTEEDMAKEACLRKLASTKRGANLIHILASAGK